VGQRGVCKGKEFAAKIIYRTTGARPKALINEPRTSPMPGIAVTVDMIAAGTDVKPVEIVLFMRAVKPRAYFEQMSGGRVGWSSAASTQVPASRWIWPV
jgi:type I restriction enzyme R subunit